MQRISLTDEQQRQLVQAADRVEFTDAQGNVLGEYRRTINYAALADEPHWPNDTEIQRIIREGRFFSSEEVLEALRKKCQ